MSRCHRLDLCLFDELPDGAARGFDPFGEGRDVQDARVPRRPWMAESAPDRILETALRLFRPFGPAAQAARFKTLARFVERRFD
jgi:hypothetical protein